MLKQLAVFTAILGSTLSLLAQGNIIFDTDNALIGGADSRIRDSFYGDAYAGTIANSRGSNYLAQLYGGSSAGNLAPIGYITALRSGAGAGWVQIAGLTPLGIDLTARGTTIQTASTFVQLRAWARPFATYEAAVAGNGRVGSSNVIPITPTFPPQTPALLIGLQGFTLVPEPSVIGLGVLGACAFLFLRRRK